MGSGCTTTAKLERIEALIADVPGDLAEIGTGSGATFWRIVAMAQQRGCMAHGFDSFAGMSEPGEFDSSHYPAGKYDAGGPEGFRKLMDARGTDRAGYMLHTGFVPKCFDDAGDLRFAFVFLDLDVYVPTLVALKWLWPRLALGGLLLADDYFPSISRGASRGIIKWLPQPGPDAAVVEIDNDQLTIRKVSL